MWLPRLPGHDDYIGRSLALLKPGGRFVEIGKRGIWSHQQILSSTGGTSAAQGEQGHSSWARHEHQLQSRALLQTWSLMSWITALLRMFEARSSPQNWSSASGRNLSVPRIVPQKASPRSRCDVWKDCSWHDDGEGRSWIPSPTSWCDFLGSGPNFSGGLYYLIFMFVWFYIIIMKYMNYVFYELYANSWLPGRNAVVFSCFGACCWSTDDLSTACFPLWCVCCLVGGLLYRSPGATTHTWSDCFSALTRGLWNRSTCILLKNHGSLDKTYTKKSSSGKFVQAKRTPYLMAKPCKTDGCKFWFSLISNLIHFLWHFSWHFSILSSHGALAP